MRLVLFRPAGSVPPAAAVAGVPPGSAATLQSNLHLLRVGALVGEAGVADVSAALVAAKLTPAPLSSMRAFLELGEAGMAVARAAAADAAAALPRASVELRAPMYDSEKVLCVGMNYADHCHEQNQPVPVEPVIFNKFASSLCASGDAIVHPAETAQLDYEVELCIVVGKECRRLTHANAMAHVAGFTVAHDVSARDWQLKKNGNQWLLGKGLDGFAPIGPAIVTPDEVGDVHSLRLRCIVNGVALQDGNTSTLVHKTEAILVWITKFITLRPGDLILTGTPPGVGCFRKPTPIWLHPGDVVTCEIEKIGSITNTVIADTHVPEKSYFPPPPPATA